jgi:EAL domain-containing protein (putative c-di-GMP-specific phosphodiesterase class I)
LAVADIGVVFQPIVDMATGALFAHEALVRCKRPEYTPPPVLFEHAVKEGACGRLGRIIRDVAFSTCGDIALFVNLHPEELTSRWLVRADDPIGFHHRPVYLEITESATFNYFDLCQSALKELCERTGALLVVDDFGAGYSNLERLSQLEPAIVKLDLALIRDIHRHPRKQIVTRHMVSLCRDLKARVVAEGVETLDELKCIRDLGVDFAQGYLLARPAAPPPVHVWPLSEVGAQPVRRGPPPLPPRKGPPPLKVTSKTSVAPPSREDAAKRDEQRRSR